MRTFLAAPFVIAAALGGAAAHAQQAHDPETLAKIAEGEVAELDMNSIRKFGDIQGRFDVHVKRQDGATSQDGTTPRTLRFMTNCQEGTMTVAAVGLFDQYGQVAKTLVSPPGAIDPTKPEKGTQEAKWLQRVCMF